MKITNLAILILLATNSSYAAQVKTECLQAAREKVTQQYIYDLQQADYKDITQLFDKNGFVISTSRGKINAKDFFYAFLPNIVSAKTILHQSFVNTADSNRLAARFSFSYKLKDGDEGQGEYVDEFVFVNNSDKLAAVYMFENIKFENETT